MKQELQNLSSTASKLGVPIQWLKERAIAKDVPCLRIKNRFLFNIEAVNQALLDLAKEKHE